MAKTINTNIDDGFLLFTFTNKQGEVFSSFKLNPTDINIAARAEELETFFEQAQESVKNVSSSKEMAEMNFNCFCFEIIVFETSIYDLL